MADLDCSSALQPCNCSSSQVCIQIGRSSTECAKNTCVDKGSSAAGQSGGGSSVGAVAGQAVGGVIGGLVIIVAVYWFWWRRRKTQGGGVRLASKNGSGGGSFFKKDTFRNNASNGNNGLKNLQMNSREAGSVVVEEKHSHSRAPAPSPLRAVSMIEEGDEEEEEENVIKRQSLRFDPSNNGTHTSRRSLSNSGAPGTGENPFGDQYSEGNSNHHRSRTEQDETSEDGTERGDRDSNAASLSEFSFRSSRTNIIPIAYIPAHSSQASTIDMTNNQSRGHAGRPQSVSTFGGGHNGARDSSGLPMRGNRASVPLSLRSTSTSNMHDSMSGATFSRLFDRRTFTHSPGINNDNRSTMASGGALEIIAPNMGATSPPLLSTPTMTKDGRPIRPPRAPGLDLKLPTPDAISPPASPGFPWNSAPNQNGNGNATPNSAATSLNLSPGANGKYQFGNLSPTTTTSTSIHQQPPLSGGRETLLSPTFAANNGRSSAYSTFSQSTDNSGSHMSYILEAPQIVTPVSASHVQVQTLSRAAARTVMLPHSNSGNSLNVIAGNGGPVSPGSGTQYASSPLGREYASSPLSDNPFDDEAAVRINMPSNQATTPSLPLTPTFGGSSPLPQSSGTRDGMRNSVATNNTEGGRRESDISIFTSSEAHQRGFEDENDDNTGTGMGGVRRTARNSFASSFASSRAGGENTSSTGKSSQQMRAPSPSSFAGTTGHTTSSGKSMAPSIHSTSSQSADEVILSPPKRPFADNNDGGFPDSRHTSAALSTRSGYGSVLDGIPFNLSLGNDARNSQASDVGSALGGTHVSVPFHFGSGVPFANGRGISMAMSNDGGEGEDLASIRDSSVPYNNRSSIASSSAHIQDSGKRDTSYSMASASTHHGGGSGNDKRDTSYSLASEWNGAFAGMPIQMGGIAEEAVPELPSIYLRESTMTNDASISTAQAKGRDERYSSDSLAMAAAVARQFDERTD